MPSPGGSPASPAPWDGASVGGITPGIAGSPIQYLFGGSNLININDFASWYKSAEKRVPVPGSPAPGRAPSKRKLQLQSTLSTGKVVAEIGPLSGAKKPKKKLKLQSTLSTGAEMERDAFLRAIGNGNGTKRVGKEKK